MKFPRDDPEMWRAHRVPTREEILAEVGRELAQRRNLYPRWIAEGKHGVTQKLADERIDALQAAYWFVMDNWPAAQGALL